MRYPEHLPSFAYTGPARYFLTFCAYRRRPCFRSARAVELVTAQFRRAADEQHFSVIAYCFMPDHVHLLTEAKQGGSDLKKFVKLAKQLAGFHYRRECHQELWQRYSYERVLRRGEDSQSVARYIIENPLRARLVARVDDYPFWGSFDYSRDQLIEYVEAGFSRPKWAT
jgi:putative transposase